MTRVAAVGAGRMGRGIAQVMAYRGIECDLVDLRERPPADAVALRDAAMAEIRACLGVLVEAGVLDAARVEDVVSRVRFHAAAGADAALARADFVFEGVTETVADKRAVLARIEAAAPGHAIVASTTSTISAETLAEGLTHPERFLNAHWLNPAYLVPLVEVSPSSRTARAAVGALTALLERAGKVPVECRPAPGYIVPRIQVVAMNEAARIVEEGVASAEDVDRAVRAGFGVRYAVMGLAEFIDFGGVDILHHASRYMTGATGEARYAAPPIVGRLMESGERGLRDGRGLHDWSEVDADAYRRETIAKFVDLLRHLGWLAPPG